MTATKVFAAGYDQDTANGWYNFPRDTTDRRKLFPAEVMSHPAKMNLYLLQEIVRYNTEPGETIMDCFGGSGTTMWAALEGRNVFALELESGYVKMMQDTLAKWDAEGLPHGNIFIVQGDNRQLMPIPVDHMVFSPPYANDMAKTTGGALNADIQRQVDAYTDSTLNLGRLNEFFYVQAMERVYDGVAASVRRNGTVTITHRDRSRGGIRILFADAIIRQMTRRGFKLENWWKWQAPGSFQSRVNEARGAEVILDEDILSFRKL